MILFDQLRLADDSSKMFINARVNGADYFNDVYIDSITIMTADRVSETSPGVPTSDYIYTKKVEGNVKEVNLVLTALDFMKVWEDDPHAMPFKQSDMSKTLFFVYIKCKGTPSGATPCTLDSEYALGVVFDETMLYQRVMDFTKDLQNECNLPVGFIDFILLWNAFKAAIETEHYIPAVKFFNMLFDIMDNKGFKGIVKGCGYHG